MDEVDQIIIVVIILKIVNDENEPHSHKLNLLKAIIN